jgi:hypothetical protein
MKLYDNGQSQRQTEPISSICIMSIKETGRLAHNHGRLERTFNFHWHAIAFQPYHFFFFINMGVRTSLRVPRQILYI